MTTVISYSCRVGQSRDRCHPTGAILAAHPAGSSYAGLVTAVSVDVASLGQTCCRVSHIDIIVKKTNSSV